MTASGDDDADAGAGRSDASAFRKTLDLKGYSFQQVVIDRCVELSSAGHWRLDVVEFPVELRGVSTRIDFVLRSKSGRNRIVAECKRVNPRLSHWWFLQAKYSRGKRTFDQALIADGLVQHEGHWKVRHHEFGHSDRLHEIGVEVPTKLRGDATGGKRDEIEDAATQVARGLNGLIGYAAINPTVLDRHALNHFIPVVFTTAQLYSSQLHPEDVSIDNGNLKDDPTLTAVDWLWYRHHRSPTLRHAIDRIDRPEDFQSLATLFDMEFGRCLAIVTPAGIEQALNAIANHVDEF